MLFNQRLFNANPLVVCLLLCMSLIQISAFATSLGNVTESVSERIRLEHLLSDETAKAKNRRALWFTLIKYSPTDLQTLTVDKGLESELKAWVQLVGISRESNIQDMLVQVEQWQRDFPGHPAQAMLASPLGEPKVSVGGAPKQIALLLPLTGPLAGPGAAIKDGFMAGVASGALSKTLNVLVYNTDQVDIKALYQQVITEGADYVVGPLSKADVATVAMIEHPVPTLLLNDVEGLSLEQAYPFGLSPTDEAVHVAMKARGDGLSQALVIAPAGPWGNAVVAEFSKAFGLKGGTVVSSVSYEQADDLDIRMRDFLGISASEARGKQLKQWLGQHIETPLTRRQDFDMIFLLAYPSKARQIMPLLKYYYAGDVPVYATSAVYSGSTDVKKDRDLNGIIFCDIPWVFDHQMGHKNWPEVLNGYNRLYAIGKESYEWSVRLNHLLIFPAVGLSDQQGVLYLSSSRKVKRILSWGEFKDGAAVRRSSRMVS